MDINCLFLQLEARQFSKNQGIYGNVHEKFVGQIFCLLNGSENTYVR